jgi:biotin operon repressor
MLQRILGTSFSTVRYHVDNLEKDGEVIRRSDRRYERLYPSGTSETMQSAYAVLQRKSARKVLQFAADHNAVNSTVADLARGAGLSRSAVAECINQLSEAGLLVRSRDADGTIRWEVRDMDLATQLLVGFRRSMIDVASDNLIDLWDF